MQSTKFHSRKANKRNLMQINTASTRQRKFSESDEPGPENQAAISEGQSFQTAFIPTMPGNISQQGGQIYQHVMIPLPVAVGPEMFSQQILAAPMNHAQGQIDKGSNAGDESKHDLNYYLSKDRKFSPNKGKARNYRNRRSSSSDSVRKDDARDRKHGSERSAPNSERRERCERGRSRSPGRNRHSRAHESEAYSRRHHSPHRHRSEHFDERDERSSNRDRLLGRNERFVEHHHVSRDDDRRIDEGGERFIVRNDLMEREHDERYHRHEHREARDHHYDRIERHDDRSEHYSEPRVVDTRRVRSIESVSRDDEYDRHSRHFKETEVRVNVDGEYYRRSRDRARYSSRDREKRHLSPVSPERFSDDERRVKYRRELSPVSDTRSRSHHELKIHISNKGRWIETEDRDLSPVSDIDLGHRERRTHSREYSRRSISERRFVEDDTYLSDAEMVSNDESFSDDYFDNIRNWKSYRERSRDREQSFESERYRSSAVLRDDRSDIDRREMGRSGAILREDSHRIDRRRVEEDGPSRTGAILRDDRLDEGEYSKFEQRDRHRRHSGSIHELDSDHLRPEKLHIKLPNICSFYNGKGCTKAGCRCLHVCKAYVLENCKFGAKCRRAHNFFTGQPYDVLKKLNPDIKNTFGIHDKMIINLQRRILIAYGRTDLLKVIDQKERDIDERIKHSRKHDKHSASDEHSHEHERRRSLERESDRQHERRASSEHRHESRRSHEHEHRRSFEHESERKREHKTSNEVRHERESERKHEKQASNERRHERESEKKHEKRTSNEPRHESEKKHEKRTSNERKPEHESEKIQEKRASNESRHESARKADSVKRMKKELSPVSGDEGNWEEYEKYEKVSDDGLDTSGPQENVNKPDLETVSSNGSTDGLNKPTDFSVPMPGNIAVPIGMNEPLVFNRPLKNNPQSYVGPLNRPPPNVPLNPAAAMNNAPLFPVAAQNQTNINNAAGFVPSVPMPGQSVAMPGQPMNVPGQPMNIPGQPMNMPGQPMNMPGQPMNMPRKPMNMPGQPMNMPGQHMPIPGQTMNMPGKPMNIPGQRMPIPGQPMMGQIRGVAAPFSVPPPTHPPPRHVQNLPTPEFLQQVIKNLPPVQNTFKNDNTPAVIEVNEPEKKKPEAIEKDTELEETIKTLWKFPHKTNVNMSIIEFVTETEAYKDEFIAEIIRILVTLELPYVTVKKLMSVIKEKVMIAIKTENDMKKILELYPEHFKIMETVESDDDDDDEDTRKIVQIKANLALGFCEKHGFLPFAIGKCDCNSLHICKFYLLSSCPNKHCKFGHKLKTEHNIVVLRNHKLHRLTGKELINFLSDIDNRNKETIPSVCKYYTREKGCYKGDNTDYDTICHSLHMCYYALKGKCSNKDCERTHSIQAKQPLSLLEKYGLDPAEYGDSTITQMIGDKIIESERDRMRKIAPLRKDIKPAQKAGVVLHNSRKGIAPATSKHVATTSANNASTAKTVKKKPPVKQCKITVQVPSLCKFYQNEPGCRKKDWGPAGKCLFLHICQFYVAGECKFGDKCKRSHDFYSGPACSLLREYNIQTHKLTVQEIIDLISGVTKTYEVAEESESSDEEENTTKVAVEIQDDANNSRNASVMTIKQEPGLVNKWTESKVNVDGKANVENVMQRTDIIGMKAIKIEKDEMSAPMQTSSNVNTGFQSSNIEDVIKHIMERGMPGK